MLAVFEIDRYLDLTAFRLHLAACSIRRSQGQIVHDLNHAYSLTGYAASHPAPPIKTLTQLNTELD